MSLLTSLYEALDIDDLPIRKAVNAYARWARRPEPGLRSSLISFADHGYYIRILGTGISHVWIRRTIFASRHLFHVRLRHRLLEDGSHMIMWLWACAHSLVPKSPLPGIASVQFSAQA
jgi:hypothetical protein